MMTKTVAFLAVNVAGVSLSASIWAPLAFTVPENIVLVMLSGLMGGIARWLADQTHIWPSGLSAMISGALCATFLWPVGQPMAENLLGKLDMQPETSVMFGGFLTGLLGISLIGAILDIFRARKQRLEAGDDAGK